MSAETAKKRGNRAFRGLALVFVLTLVNFVGLLLTVIALGGLGAWTRWQFMGLFGVIETAAGLSNIIAPNIWRLPAAEIGTSKRTSVRLAATTMLIPHWGGGARAAAGISLLFVAGFGEGWAAGSVLVVVLIGLLIVLFLGISAAIARVGVAISTIDTIQFIIRWRGKDSELQPLSISASLQQFVLGILTLPAVKALQPGVLFGPAFQPSALVLAIAAVAALLSVLATLLLWRGRIQWRAPSEQQREAELNA